MKNQNINRDITVVVIVIVVALTVLVGLGKDINVLIGFLTAAIIPTVATMLNTKRLEQVAGDARSAKELGETAVHNTNGRMTELIRIIQSNGIDVPEGYEDLRAPDNVDNVE